MITDKTLDEALVEVMRCKRALEALRAERKALGDLPYRFTPAKRHAAALRASMDLTRKLADLRAGR